MTLPEPEWQGSERSLFQEFAAGLGFPEGPVALADGSVLSVEIVGRSLVRVASDGSVMTRVARLSGGPNGAAIGPDGRCYVCNNGGLVFRELDGRILPGVAPEDHRGGWIEAVDLATGEVEMLYEGWRERRLSAPNDIVFDEEGGFYFTDSGRTTRHNRDRGAVYYARADGSEIVSTIFPMEVPNGIGLSPDGRTLYVAETATGRLWAFDLVAPGVIRRGGGPTDWQHGRMVYARDSYCLFDSLAVEANGNICVAEISTGKIVVVSPAGELVEEYAFDDRFTTNICFGGRDLRTAFVTLSSTGRLARLRWPRAGLAPHWSGL